MNKTQVCGSLKEKTSLFKVKFLEKPVFHLVLVCLLGLAAYSNTSGVPFMFDDRDTIVENPLIRDLSNIPALFAGPKGPFASRPLMLATFALNYHFGELDTWGYHVVNLAIHFVNGILLYLLVLMTGRRLGYAERAVGTAALMASSLFLLHPVQTETVTNIVNRSMLLAAAFYISGLILFLKAVTTEKRRPLYLGGLFLASLLGVGSRENFSTFPLVLFLYDLFFISHFSLRETKKHWKAYLPVLLGLGYIAFLAHDHTYERSIDFPGIGVPSADYFRTQFNVHWSYLRLLVLPVNQNLDYDYHIARTLFAFPTLLSLIGYLALLAASILLAKKRPLFSFSALWFFITLIPISFLVVFMGLRLDDVIFEHRLYLPGAAFFALAGAGLAFALEKLGVGKLRTTAAAVAVIVPLLLATTTFKRNAVWQSTISLWEDAARKSPQKARPHYGLGTAYDMAGQLDMAIEEYLDAIELKPGYVEAHNNLGVAYVNIGQYDKAIEQYFIAIKLKPDYADAHNNLGVAYANIGQYDKAIEQYSIAIKLKPDYADAHNHNNRGWAYMRSGQIKMAIDEFRTAIRLNPDFAMAYVNLGIAYKEMGLAEEAEEQFRIARELNRRKQ